jgi:plastocyanin
MRVPAWKPVAVTAVLLFGQALVSAAPAVAAGPITITADMPAAVPAGHNWSFDDYFPRTLRVPQGTTLQFVNQGFHTATLLPHGTSARSDEKANGIVSTDADDTTRNINGTTHAQFNLASLAPIPAGCGTWAAPCVFDGSAIVSSGASLGPPSGPFVVTMSAPTGTYVYHCRIHPGMTGRITIVPPTASGTSPATLADKVQDQVKAAVHAGYKTERAAGKVAKVRNRNGTSTWFVNAGTGSPDGRVAVLEFLPTTIKIDSGDRVVWRSREPNEPHTVTFPGELFSDLVPLCENGATDSPATPLHVPPQGPADFTCGGPPVEIELGGGNGVWKVTDPTTISDSGVIASRAASRAFGLPRSGLLSSWKVSFRGAIAGTYTYICQIHGAGMSGTVVVH